MTSGRADSESTGAGGVLLVDDDEEVLRAHTLVLERAGLKVTSAKSGEEAVAALAQKRFDVIVSDIWMPKMDGIALLEHVRTVDLDVPVILVTGAISEPLSLKAVEHGALRTLTKPIDRTSFVATVREAQALCRLARARREVRRMTGSGPHRMGDVASLVTRFNDALATLHVAYQPIVDIAAKQVVGYEAFLRTDSKELLTPLAVIDAAELVGRLRDLGRTLRARIATDTASLPPELLVFLKLLPVDLDEGGIASEALPPALKVRSVLQISERASIASVVDATRIAATLRRDGHTFAIDDFGAGDTGLSRFTALAPAYTKLDRALLEGIAEDRPRQFVVRTMVDTCRELGMKLVAKGVERASERDALHELGCTLMQGYLFAHPSRELAQPIF
ncbi:hypothetical protein BH09MYX1_BH09MYX1_03500 [soil metagenome]